MQRMTQRLARPSRHKPSSQRWLLRQLNDPYCQRATQEGWRSRAAFKLLELDERFDILKKNICVVDLGAAPGSWTEVALKAGVQHVVGVDMLPIEPLDRAEWILGDFTDQTTQDELVKKLPRSPGVVLCDIAPNTTGHAKTDFLRISAIVEAASAFAVEYLSLGGDFVAKLFQGGAERDITTLLQTYFTSVHYAKPKASRKESRELYLVAKAKKQDFRIVS